MVGKTISHYDIRMKLGAGGMGEIYKAFDSKLNRAVAIKVLSAGDAGAYGHRRRRFIQEAQAASALNHPNIITIHDIVSEQEIEYMVMEFVDGQTLDEAIPPNGLEAERALDYAIQIADALRAAHGAGIIHRDLKPANIMVTNAGLIKVLDFGLAKVELPSTGDRASTMTSDGAILGTVNYMAPEQAEGKRVDARSDIFSFGLVLYEMITGQRAFDGDSQLSILAAILRDPIQLSPAPGGVAPELAAIVERAVAKNPDERWQEMTELRQALAGLRYRSDSTVVLSARPKRRLRMPSPTVVVSLVAAALAVCLAGALWWKAHRAVPPLVVQSAPAPPPVLVQPPAAEAVLTNDAVVEMWKAKVPPSLILSQMKAGKTRFDLSPQGVIDLTQAGLPDYLVEAMRDPAKGTIPAPHRVVETVRPPAPAPAPPARYLTLTVPDATPFNIILLRDVPATVDAGAAIHFQAAVGLKVGNTHVIGKDAPVRGTIVEAARKKLLRDGKVTFRLEYAEAVNGSRLKLRLSRSNSAPIKLDNPRYTAPKGIVASAGTPYTAYVDGDQKLTVRYQ